MRWPYSERVDATPAWGTAGAGIAIGGIIIGALASLHGNDPHFRWWWPTDWMIVPFGIFLVGLIMVFVPLRRRGGHSDQMRESQPQPPQVPQIFEQKIIAEAPGAKAQGAVFGNVINYPRQVSNGAPGPTATESADNQP